MSREFMREIGKLLTRDEVLDAIQRGLTVEVVRHPMCPNLKLLFGKWRQDGEKRGIIAKIQLEHVPHECLEEARREVVERFVAKYREMRDLGQVIEAEVIEV